MEYKYIGGRKWKKSGCSQLENEEMERTAMLSIRSNSEALNSLFNQISMYSHSMLSPTASPIKPNTNSNTTFNYTPIRQFIQAPSFKKQLNKKQQNNPQVKTLKKKSISSVHFTNYMKPIGKVSDKLKGILQKQQEYREMEAEREMSKVNNLKKRTRQQYKNIEPKYQQYKQTKSKKQQAIAYRIVQKSESQMSGVTFMPKINHNITIHQPFQTRMQHHQQKKQQRSCVVIQQIMKKQTFKPKINQSVQVQSRVKQIWKKSPLQKDSFIASSNSFKSDFKEMFEREPGEYRVVNSLELGFINKN